VCFSLRKILIKFGIRSRRKLEMQRPLHFFIKWYQTCMFIREWYLKGADENLKWSNITIKNEVLCSVSFLHCGNIVFIGDHGFLFTSSGHLSLDITSYTFWHTLKNCHNHSCVIHYCHLPHPIHHLPFNIHYQNMGFM